MSFSPIIDQRPLIPNGSTDCAEASLFMCLNHLGHKVSIHDILSYHSSYTDISVLEDMCQHFGLRGTYITGSGFDNNDKLVIALFHDNNQANPDVHGSFEHYGVVYAQPGGNSVQVANPWGARDVNYPDSQFNPAYIAAVVIPIALNTVGADDMTPEQLALLNQLNANVKSLNDEFKVVSDNLHNLDPQVAALVTTVAGLQNTGDPKAILKKALAAAIGALG